MKIREKEQEALRVQRHGYLRTYATMMLEIDALYEQLGQLTAGSRPFQFLFVFIP